MISGCLFVAATPPPLFYEVGCMELMEASGPFRLSQILGIVRDRVCIEFFLFTECYLIPYRFTMNENTVHCYMIMKPAVCHSSPLGITDIFVTAPPLKLRKTIRPYNMLRKSFIFQTTERLHRTVCNSALCFQLTWSLMQSSYCIMIYLWPIGRRCTHQNILYFIWSAVIWITM